MKRFVAGAVAFSICLTLGGATLLEKNPQKDYVLEGFRSLVTARRIPGTNRFFICRKGADDYLVYWREGRELWRMSLDPYYESPGKTELTVRAVWKIRFEARFKPIDLDTDVVPDGVDTGPSTYLVQRQYVAGLVYDCVFKGELLEILDSSGESPGPQTYRIQAQSDPPKGSR